MKETNNSPKKYYLGLDVGTDSVGFAVTDEHYHLVRKQGKHLWGARLFDEANDASSRRANREARRRLQRRKWRISLLQDLFKEEMDKVDPYFFDRLNNSSLHQEDKPENLRTTYLLFNDLKKTDKDFYKKYPTIYHLRKAMIEEDKKFSIKEIYLVMAHMIKYRGNFLTDGDISASDIGHDETKLIELFNELDSAFGFYYDSSKDGEQSDYVTPFSCDKEKANALMKLFIEESRTGYLKSGVAKILEFGGAQKLKPEQATIIQLICGGKSSLFKVFPEEKDSDKEDISIEFDSDNFDEVFANLEDNLGDEDKINIIKIAKDIYDYRVLLNLLKGKSSLSEAMVEIFDEHKVQLKILKSLFNEYAKDKKKSFFVDAYGCVKDKNGKEKKAKLANYVNYIGLTNNGKKRVTHLAHETSQDDLYKTIYASFSFFDEKKKVKEDFSFKSEEDKQNAMEMAKAMESHTFLRRQNSKENGVLCYQLNKNEMIKIIEKQGRYYPFLMDKDSSYRDPTATQYKLVFLLEFKIPYFIGPLSSKKGYESKNQWMIRRQEGTKITPWNFYTVVDTEKTAEKFIERMKNKCTYLIGEETLPAFSLLYSAYVWLNEINNWMVIGHNIKVEEKRILFDFYVQLGRTPRLKQVKEKLSTLYRGEEVSLLTRTGKEVEQEDIHANLKAFHDLSNENALGPCFYKDKELFEKGEEIIETITIIEDKFLKEKKLRSLGFAEDPQLRFLKSLNYTGWGKMSKKVLNGLTTPVVNPETGEIFDETIIDLMWKTPQNFMEILEKKDSYSFRSQIDKMNSEQCADRNDLVNSLYASPAMKRSVFQTLKIIDELKEILHIESFDTFFVECTRRNDEKRRTVSRKKKIQDIYASIKEVDNELKEELESKDDNSLRGKKLFLYFMQMGKSVYTGKIIDLERLDKDYDIDHIIPQATLKDDSFLNTVLVEKTINNQKQDAYPIPQSILNSDGRTWVKTLARLSRDLMPKEKEDRILRSVANPLKDEEVAGFVNRQLTMTDQSVKAICDVLRETEKESKIVYSKAGLVSDFRACFNLPKCREINDFHHAHDAYLNIVVGNVFNKVFTSNFSVQYYQEHFKNANTSLKHDVKHVFKRDEYINNIRKPELCVWTSKKYLDKDRTIEDQTFPGTIDLIRKILSWNDPMVTQMLHEQKGKQGFFNKITLRSVEDKEATFPLKTSANSPYCEDDWKSKYGGYSDLTTPYFMLVKSLNKKKEIVYSLEGIPTIKLAQLKTKEEKEQYLANAQNGYKLTNPIILLDKILIGTVIEFDKGVRLGVSGRTNSNITFVNLNQLHLSNLNSNQGLAPADLAYFFKKAGQIFGTNQGAGSKMDLSSYNDSTEIKTGHLTIDSKFTGQVFDYLVKDVLTRDLYLNMPGMTGKIKKFQIDDNGICEVADTFNNLRLIDKIKVLLEMIKISGSSTPSSDFSLVKLGKLNNAYLSCNKNLPRPFKIIRQSTTGFFESVIFDSEQGR